MANILRQHLIIYQGSYFDSENLTIQFWESIQLKEAARAKSGISILSIYDLLFQIDAGSSLIFDNGISLVVTDTTMPGSNEIRVNNIPQFIEKNAIARVRPLNLTGYQTRSKLRKNHSATQSVVIPWVILNPATNGKIAPDLSDSVTASLPANCTFQDISKELLNDLQNESLWTSKLKKAAWVWDLELVSPANKPKRRAEGRVLIPAEVTRDD